MANTELTNSLLKALRAHGCPCRAHGAHIAVAHQESGTDRGFSWRVRYILPTLSSVRDFLNY